MRDAERLANFVPRNWGAAQLKGESVTDRVLVYAFERGAADKIQSQVLKEVAMAVQSSFPGVKLTYKWLD